MPRFIKQVSPNTCGAVALINSFKHIRHKSYTSKDVKPISKKIKTNENGTWDCHLIRYLKKEKFTVGYQKCLAYTSVRYALEKKKNFILIMESEHYCHYVSVVGVTKKGVWLANSPKFSEYLYESDFPRNVKSKVFFTFNQLKYFCVNYKHHFISMIYFSKKERR